ncbi:MAG TPA: flagellar hook-basal body protein [Gaiellaceae bacterium]|jgi:flagellar basal-body rod protein FlgG
MADGIYAAAAGMAAQQTRLEAIANDLANAGTAGYKSERVGFKDLVYGSVDGVAVGSGAAAVDAGPSMVQGTLTDSSDPLSLALDGPGFFQIRRADGSTGLTRDGDFMLDAAGNLVTSQGEQLVPPIKVPAGVQPKNVTVAADGTVSAPGRTLGKLQIVDVPSPNGLLAVGSSTFLATAASGAAAPARGTQVKQHQLEASNVDTAEAMTDLLDAQQTYTLASRALSIQDQMLQIANQIKN